LQQHEAIWTNFQSQNISGALLDVDETRISIGQLRKHISL